MTLWTVRASEGREAEPYALENNRVVVAWDDVDDLSVFTSIDQLKAELVRVYTDIKPSLVSNWAGQLWKFAKVIAVGDTVCLPFKGQPYIAVGEITGDYYYDSNAPAGALHQRGVRWLNPRLERGALDQDIFFSLGSLLTVSRPQATEAEARIRAIVGGSTRPAGGTLGRSSQFVETSPDLSPLTRDMADDARSQIVELISQKYKGHGLADLVGDLLTAEGFTVEVSAPGPDGGVDILAGKGTLGLESPRLVVQVKSSNTPTDAPAVRQLQGVMARYKAEYGLFVSWGGYKSTVRTETAHDHFSLRFWTAKEVVDAVLDRYDRLSSRTRATLRLRRIWAITPEDV